MMVDRYRYAFTDWMACAVGGMESVPTSLLSGDDLLGSSLHDDVTLLGAAGHVLDFDDTFAPGLSHLSAATAPAATLVAARLGRNVGQLLEAYAQGFEVMGRVAEASHPKLYDAGWHATAVCGGVGAAAVTAALVGLDRRTTEQALRLAILRAAGLRSAFGSLGKSLQIGLAAATGVTATRLAAAGARVPKSVATGPSGFSDVFGGSLDAALDSGHPPAIASNWLKAHPCCLQTHGPIDAADEVRQSEAKASGSGVVVVHPVSRQAAFYDDVATGLEAKFSIPYTMAWTLAHGPPGVEDFTDVDDDVRRIATAIDVETDPSLSPNEARFSWRDREGAHQTTVVNPRGSPQRPLTETERWAKVRSLASRRLDGLLDDLDVPAKEVAHALGF